MTQAWWTGRLSGATKPPPLKDLLIPENAPATRRKQSWQEIKANFMLALGPGNSTPRKK